MGEIFRLLYILYYLVLFLSNLILFLFQNELVGIRGNLDEIDSCRIEDFDVEGYLVVIRVKKGDDVYVSNVYN